MMKWRLLLTTLPLVAAVVAVKEIARIYFHFDGLVELSELSVVFTAAFFLNGFMLAGTMADYKESEKLPGEVANCLESMEDSFVHAANVSPQVDLANLRSVLLRTGEAVLGWIRKDIDRATAGTALDELRGTFRALERRGVGTNYIMRSLGDLANLRRSLTRIEVISRTNFIATGYALLESLAGFSMLMLIIARFKSPIAEVIVVSTVTLLQVYMLRLIRDVDDPFEYGGSSGSMTGTTEVALFPITEYLAVLKARVARPRTVMPAPLTEPSATAQSSAS